MGAPAVEPPNGSTWRSSALAGKTERMLSAAVARDEREPQEPSEDQARKSGDERRRDQPPVGGHRGGAKPQLTRYGKGMGSRGPCLQQQC